MIQLPESIRAYLDGLTDVEQDRVLTRQMISSVYISERTGCGCLLGTARGYGVIADMVNDPEGRKDWFYEVSGAYEVLCSRFGTAAVGAAIREYLVTHRQPLPVLTEAVR